MEPSNVSTGSPLTLQQPIGSGFNEFSTATEVIKGIDLTGKIAIVTGGYAGLGLETTKTLAAAGATVIVPARSLDKALQNLNGIKGVEVHAMDLINPASIDAFAEQFLAQGKPLHLLINNAGTMFAPFSRDAKGYESHFSTNHLGHFQLTARLWPALQKANGARVINVSSWGHHFSPIVFEDPNFEKREYNHLAAYGQSKTANILFSLELDRRGKTANVSSFSLHPGGIVETDLKRHASAEELQAAGVYDNEGKPVHDPANGLKSIEQGASTTIWCATSAQLNNKGGVYCENTEVAVLDTSNIESNQLGGSIARRGVMSYAINPDYAKQLWTLSEELTGVAFTI